MDTFIITGANTEPAQSIARRLCEIGARVYGIAGTFSENSFSHEEFFPIACDITSPADVSGKVQKIIDAEHNICGLILATQFLETEAFETLPTEEISLSVNALISAPLIITRIALPKLIEGRGNLIAISPNTVTPRGHVMNNIMEAAMKTLAGTIFGELRDTGVRTCHILLQNNPGVQDPATQYTNAPQSRVHADIVADTVETIINLRENNALTQIVLRPQATRETPHIPISAEPKIRTLQVVQLPPTKNFPPEQKSIYTEKYRRPDYAPKVAKDDNSSNTDEDDGFDDDYVDPELRYLLKNPGKNNERNAQPQQRGNGQREQSQQWQEGNQQFQQQFDENGNPIQRKRKRHRNRHRNRNRDRNGNDFSPNGGMHVRPPEVFSRNEQRNSEQKAQEQKSPSGAQQAPQRVVPAEVTKPAPAVNTVKQPKERPQTAKTVPADKAESVKRKSKPRIKKPEKGAEPKIRKHTATDPLGKPKKVRQTKAQKTKPEQPKE